MKGYTLIEVTVALVIASLIITAGAVSLNTYLRNKEAVEKTAKNAERRILAAYLLRSIFQNRVDSAFNRKVRPFTRNSCLYLLTATPFSTSTKNAPPGLYAVKLCLTEEKLTLSSVPLTDKKDLEDFFSTTLFDGERSVVLESADSVEFYYRGKWENQISHTATYMRIKRGDQSILIPLSS